jgi:CubicO group peptidase (beta-lactamase class C family)
LLVENRFTIWSGCALTTRFGRQVLVSTVERIDSTRRRSMSAHFADEVAGPLGIDFFIGLPDAITSDRLAVFSGGGRVAAALHARQMPRTLLLAMLNPRSTTARAFANPRLLAMNASNINRRDILRAEFPSMNGVGEVRAIAKVYGELTIGGAGLGLRQETIDELERDVPASFDVVFRLDSAFTMGFMKPFPLLRFGASPRAYGHSGLGGSFAFSDPDAGVGYAYAMNRAGYSLPTDPREVVLREAVYACV